MSVAPPAGEPLGAEPPRGGAPAAGQPLWPVGVAVVAMGCFQLGTSVGKSLFPVVGSLGATTLRIGLSALILFAFTRPWRQRLRRGDWPPLLAYGLSLAGLNTFFFLAVARVPLGVAVAVDFLGPLGVAVAYSRRLVDGLWVALAATGILLLVPLGLDTAAIDPLGLMLCLLAAMCWASYIVFGRALGARLPSGPATALGMTVAALVVLPFGVASAGASLLSPAILPLAVGMAILSSALPNSLEMVAMRRLPPRLFGVLMSLEPALGALFGWLVLGEHLNARQLGAIALVMLASGGATLTASRATPVPTDG